MPLRFKKRCDLSELNEIPGRKTRQQHHSLVVRGFGRISLRAAISPNPPSAAAFLATLAGEPLCEAPGPV